MKITTLHLLHALAFDSIINVLSWYDRASIHLYINDKITGGLSERIRLLATAIAEHNLEAPKMNYGHDRLLYFIHPYTGQEFPVENYFICFPEIKNKLNIE